MVLAKKMVVRTHNSIIITIFAVKLYQNMNMQLNLMEVNTNNLPNKHTQPTMMVIDNQIRIPYTIQNFPDGQNSIIIRELNYEEMCSDIKN